MSDDELPCPCDRYVFPVWPVNPPGRTRIDYRVGDFASFRRAMLRPLEGEQALRDWQPGAEGDLAVQLIDWWAYLADVLAFYNERALHEVLLRTAHFPDDVRRIIRLLGYRPRPGIGATGVVAAIVDSPRPVLVSRGFPIQASMGPGRPPQVFEVDRDVELGLLGQPLPASARFPAAPSSVDTTSTWQGYVDRDTRGNIPNAVPARRKKKGKKMPPIKAGTPARVAVEGLVTNAGPEDTILILKRDWKGDDLLDMLPGRAIAVIDKLESTWDENGNPVTVLTLHPGQTLPFGADRDEYRLLKATKSAHLWLYHERYPGNKQPTPGGMFLQHVEQFFDPAGLFTGGISTEPPQDPHALTSNQLENPLVGAAHLEAICRGINPGDPVMFEKTIDLGGAASLIAQMFGVGAQLQHLVEKLEREVAFVARVTGYSELVWYANPPELDRIGQGPPIGPPSSGFLSGGAVAIPIPHSKITFNDPFLRASMMSVDDLHIKNIVVHYAWQQVGGDFTDIPATASSTEPEVPPSPATPANTPLPVIVEDATGAGVPAWMGVTTEGDEGRTGPQLVGPLRALLHLMPVSRGQTVAGEVLGSGSSILVNQEFMLRQKPLTYLHDTGPRSTNGYRSTLRVRVDGIEWHEVPSFFEQQPNARVFVTREDDEQRTFVRFGDGEFGARLPTGVDNVVASYRYGSGAAVPPIGALTQILEPQKGLRSIRNPIQPGGGADPDRPEQIRTYAPRSVMTFGRAISGDDYEAIAAQTPGVRRAKVRWGWDAASQRSRVKVFVGDDEAAVVAARDALRAYSDPNRPVMVALATPVYIDVSLTVEVDRDYLPSVVGAAVTEALLDPASQPFGIDVVRIGDVVYNSEIYDACLAVPGVIAVHALELRRLRTLYPLPLLPTAAPGFSLQHPMWTGAPAADLGVFPGLFEALPFTPGLPASPIARLGAEYKPPLLPLTTYLANLANDAFAERQAVIDATVAPPTTAPGPLEEWILDPGERHAPGEGKFYLLKSDRLHVATEVWRHGR